MKPLVSLSIIAFRQKWHTCATRSVLKTRKVEFLCNGLQVTTCKIGKVDSWHTTTIGKTVGLSIFNYAVKIKIFMIMWYMGQIRENLAFHQCLVEVVTICNTLHFVYRFSVKFWFSSQLCFFFNLKRSPNVSLLKDLFLN